MNNIKYRPDIDGLRAVAIIPVLLFHLGVTWLPGGFLGVDVFFVISGYLITSIILKDYDSDKFTFANFWARRVRRIFPVLAVMVIVTLSISYFIVFRPDLQSYGLVGLSSIFSVANITLWKMMGNYWGPTAELSPFLHTWSLSVEEQFYLFYPVLLFVLMKYLRNWIVFFLSLIIVVSFILFVYSVNNYPAASFYLLPMRSWELACGCLLAVLHYKKCLKLPKLLVSALPFMGLALISYSYVAISGEDGLSSIQALAVVGSLFIIMGRSDNAAAKSILASALPVYIGKISYSLYMWHWPIIVLGKSYYHQKGLDPSVPVLLAVIFVVSVVSYYALEKTTRSMKRIAPLAILLLVFSSLLSGFLAFGNYNVQYDASDYGAVEYYGQMYDLSPVQPPIDRQLRLKRTGIHAPDRDSWAKDVYASGGVIRRYSSEDPDIMLLGDSHALMWAKSIDEIAEDLKISVALNGMTGTNPFFSIPLDEKPRRSNRYSSEQKYLFDKARFEKIKEWKPKLVIIASRWSSLKEEQINLDLIRYIGEQGGEVLLIESPPELFIGNSNASQYLAFLGMDSNKGRRQYLSVGHSDRYEKGRELVEKIVQRYPHCHLFELSPDLLNSDGKVLVMDGSQILYYDDDHLSYQGATKIKSRLRDVIMNIVGMSD